MFTITAFLSAAAATLMLYPILSFLAEGI